MHCPLAHPRHVPSAVYPPQRQLIDRRNSYRACSKNCSIKKQ